MPITDGHGSKIAQKISIVSSNANANYKPRVKTLGIVDADPFPNIFANTNFLKAPFQP
jgi:hypothetical protein